jgi:hypothetical protein
MKPDWNSPDCPEWANYLAMAANGAWWWYENKPFIWNSKYSHEWQPNGDSQMAMVGLPWRDTLEERPVNKSSFDYHAEGIQE